MKFGSSLSVAAAVLAGTLSAVPIVERGASTYAIVAADTEVARVAADELRELVFKSTGVNLPVSTNTPLILSAQTPRHLFVGQSPATEQIFGKLELPEGESRVVPKDGALLFCGGGWRGDLDAVYRFVRERLGYRMYSCEEGAEKVAKTDRVELPERELVYRQAFVKKHELTHTYLYGSTNLIPFLMRNGSYGKKSWAKNTKFRNLERDLPMRDEGHGFFLYVGCSRYGWKAYEWDDGRRDYFKEHPEWFSMSNAGGRSDRLQLCFSNKGLRQEFTRRVLERCRRVGGSGVLTIGANDVPGPFCSCHACKRLIAQYETPAGPYWDYLPALCAAVAKEYPAIRIETLAYRKQQSENFPKGIARFPSNFICDFAPVDDDQSQNIGGKGNEKTLENLKKWCAACDYVDYWYYDCASSQPFGLVSRMQGDLQAMAKAGVKGAKLCGLSSIGLTHLKDYLWFRLLEDPWQDAWAVVDEFCDFQYGPAAAVVKGYARALDELWKTPQKFVTIDQRVNEMRIYKPEWIIRWQREFAAAAALVKGDAVRERNLSWVRWDLDRMTLAFWREVREAKGRPADLTPEAVFARSKTVTLPRRYGLRADRRYGREKDTGLYAQMENDCLVAKALDKPIPEPLASLPEGQVVQIPQCGGYMGKDDPDAACGAAKTQHFAATQMTGRVKRLSWCMYDWAAKRTLSSGKIDVSDAVPGKYELRKVCDTRIPRGAAIEIDTWWGIGQSFAEFYPEGDENRVFEVWGSFKFVGPSFGIPTDDGKDRVYCDRFFLVDRNGKKYKGDDETPYDLVIYGSSPAGLAAAVQARRMGLKAVVISPEKRIGGLTTGGLGQTDIGNRQAFGGIALEFYRDVARHYRDPRAWTREKMSDYSPDGQCFGSKGADSMWTFEPSAARRILEGWERRDGLEIARGKRLDRSEGKVRTEGQGRQRRIVSLVTEDGVEYRGRMFVDATYEGDLMAAAGVSCTVGREANSVYGETLNGIQRRQGYHKFEPKVSAYVVPGDPKSGLLPNVTPDTDEPDGAGDRRVQAYCFRMCLTDDPANRIPFAKPAGYSPLDYELLIRNLAEQEKNHPEWRGSAVSWHGFPWINSRMPNRKTDTNNCRGFSTDFIGRNWAWPEATYAEREKILKEHLDYQRGLMWTLANDPRIPERIRKEVARWGTCKDEFPDGLGDGWQDQLYVREGRRMVSDYVMTEQNCRGERVAPHPIAMGAYSMDSHHVRRYADKDGYVQNEGDVEVNRKRDGTRFEPYGIEYAAIVPKRAECGNLFVPVCLSASHIAFGSIRMEPVFFALGQAAGTAAALAIADGVSAQDVDYGKLSKRLAADGQVLGLVRK